MSSNSVGTCAVKNTTPVRPSVSMVNLEWAPVPTCISKHEPSAAMGVMVSPSSTTVQSPLMSALPAVSEACIVASVGASVGMMTIFIDGSAYAPSTFCMCQVWVVSSTANTPVHSKPLQMGSNASATELQRWASQTSS